MAAHAPVVSRKASRTPLRMVGAASWSRGSAAISGQTVAVIAFRMVGMRSPDTPTQTW